MGLRAQKKLLGKMASKKIAKVFIDDTAGRLLDNMFKISKSYADKKTSEKVMNHLIKTVIKIGILYRNDQFTSEEIGIAEQFKKKFRSIIMTVISFYEVDFSFDKNYLSRALLECSTLLKMLIQNHLTDKSQQRIDNVFGFYSNTDFLEALFQPEGPFRDVLSRMVTDLHILLEEGTL